MVPYALSWSYELDRLRTFSVNLARADCPISRRTIGTGGRHFLEKRYYACLIPSPSHAHHIVPPRIVLSTGKKKSAPDLAYSVDGDWQTLPCFSLCPPPHPTPPLNSDTSENFLSCPAPAKPRLEPLSLLCPRPRSYGRHPCAFVLTTSLSALPRLFDPPE